METKELSAKSRVRGDFQARFCEKGRVKLPPTYSTKFYAKQGRIIANDYAEKARSLFEKDKQLTYYYNHVMGNGKWKGMMLDKHIGYKEWFMPEKSILPPMDTVSLKAGKDLAVALEGSEGLLEGKYAEATITLDCKNFELFDAGTNTVRAKAGNYEVYYGNSSADKDLKKLNVTFKY